MVQIDKQPGAIGVRASEQSARLFYLILYPKEL
jgi:hypothetical protein